MMQVMVNGKTGFQIGDNSNLFDFTYIENAACAHLLAADRLSPDHPKYSKVAGQAFFITNGEPVYYWDFPRALWRAAGHTPEKVTVVPKPVALVIAAIMEFVAWLRGKEPFLTRVNVHYTCLNRYCNIAKARDALDYDPPVTLQEGIRRAVEVSRLVLWHVFK